MRTIFIFAIVSTLARAASENPSAVRYEGLNERGHICYVSVVKTPADPTDWGGYKFRFEAQPFWEAHGNILNSSSIKEGQVRLAYSDDQSEQVERTCYGSHGYKYKMQGYSGYNFLAEVNLDATQLAPLRASYRLRQYSPDCMLGSDYSRVESGICSSLRPARPIVEKVIMRTCGDSKGVREICYPTELPLFYGSLSINLVDDRSGGYCASKWSYSKTDTSNGAVRLEIKTQPNCLGVFEIRYAAFAHE